MSRPRGTVLRLDPGRTGREALSKMFGVHTSSILKWIRRVATGHSVKPDPTGKAIVMQIDEMWHFLKKTLQALDLKRSRSRYRPTP
jgi:transposase